MEFQNIESFIFITMDGDDFQEEWEILKDFDNNPFTNLEEAKTFVRETIGKFKHVGLARFNQMLISNAEWDNF